MITAPVGFIGDSLQQERKIRIGDVGENDADIAGGAGFQTFAQFVGHIIELGSRMKLWHINDRGCRKAGFTPIYKMDSMELGYGTMDLETMARQAKENSIDAVILESHRNWIDGDPVKSAQRSSEFLNRHF